MYSYKRKFAEINEKKKRIDRKKINVLSNEFDRIDDRKNLFTHLESILNSNLYSI